jgi:hypothetical protein
VTVATFVVAALAVLAAPAVAEAQPRDPGPGVTCAAREDGRVRKAGMDRVRCQRGGRGHRWEMVERPRVMLFGDSLAAESAAYFQFFGTLAGADVRSAVYGGTAICDWFPAMVDAVRDFQPESVVLAFTGNAMTACMHDGDGAPLRGQAIVDKYTADVAVAMWILSHSARSITWVGPPASAALNPTTDALRAMYGATPTWWEHARYVDGGALLNPGNAWSAMLPCLFFEPCVSPVIDGVGHNVVRAPDTVHFCPTAGEAVNGVLGECSTYSSRAVRYAVALLQGPVQDFDL